MTGWRLAVVAAVVFLAALCGVWAGRMLLPAPKDQSVAIHDFVHDRLDLDDGQKQRLHAMEQRFAIRRAALEATMRQENAQLAAAIRTEHRIGPGVSAAVDASHRTMGTLQKETLAHIFAMRSLLRPQQAAKFDAAITGALTESPR
ncbi:Heavy-metal resistance [Sphingomonas gellani]|uniref:Heavy-metal resistance n=1 Tax=Sphingomonas gellani TaxID=1166340 RepID=A0A1H8H7C4_9SPHN|nr:periplasmic heavy metal sensor [Sphingomonas gellani]SEN52156.1 Heavy-metal resistance [Sphingomonas gellani]